MKIFREEFKEKNEIKQIGLWSLFSPSYLENDTSYNKSVQLPTGLFWEEFDALEKSGYPLKYLQTFIISGVGPFWLFYPFYLQKYKNYVKSGWNIDTK